MAFALFQCRKNLLFMTIHPKAKRRNTRGFKYIVQLQARSYKLLDSNLYYCFSTRTIWAILQFDWFPRPILSANITFPQCYGTLSRQVTVKVMSSLQSWFQNFLLTRFACFQAIFLCRSKADVRTRLNVHVRSVIRKTVKLTKTALSNDRFSAIVWEAHLLNTVMFSA